MKPILAEDMREILNRLDEYLVDLGETEKPKDNEAPSKATPAGKSSDSPAPKDDKEPTAKDDSTTNDDDQKQKRDAKIDDVLRKPSGLRKLVGTLNVQMLADLLEIPERYRSSFRGAIQNLRSDSRVPNANHNMALAIAFSNALDIFQTKLAHMASSMGPRGAHVEEELDANKLQSYLAKDKAQANKAPDGVDHMKQAIAAVSKHGTPDEKKELGLDEQAGGKMPVKIIAYNSGLGEKLPTVANDPKRHREVLGSLEMGSNGQPILRFTEKNDNQVYTAEWMPQYGWVADFD